MTPTEQDKELREQLQWISYKAVVTAYNTSQAGLIDYAHELTEELVQLITADRKRATLEALEKAFGSGERGGMDNWGRSVNIYLRKRIAELKAQQEEV